MRFFETKNQYLTAWLDSCGFPFHTYDDYHGLVFQFEKDDSLEKCVKLWNHYGGANYRNSIKKVMHIISTNGK